MENMVSENLRQRCARLGVRFDGEFSGLLWFADKKEGERSNGAGFVIKAGLAEPEKLLEEKLCEIRQRFRTPGVLRDKPFRTELASIRTSRRPIQTG
jgi:hypothetical protein